MGRLDGKVALITGGAGGFGKGACELWAREGAKILTCDVKVAEGEAVAKEIRSNGGEIVFLRADVSKTEDAKRIVAKTIETYGALDILYNNAGILGPRGVEIADFTEEDTRRLWEINFMGVFLPTKFALPEMVKRGGGSIISTGSESAFRGNGGFCVYGPTKIAVINLSMVTAMEYADRGIRSNAVSPGAARTPMHNDLYDGKSDLMETSGGDDSPEGRRDAGRCGESCAVLCLRRLEVYHWHQPCGRRRLARERLLLSPKGWELGVSSASQPLFITRDGSTPRCRQAR